MHNLQRWIRSIGNEPIFEALVRVIETTAGPQSAVFATDRDQNVVYWSAGAEALLGFSAAEMLGQHCLKGNRCAACIAGCGVAEHGIIDEVPLQLHTKDGRKIPVRKTGQAFRDAEGTVLGTVEVLVPETDEGATVIHGAFKASRFDDAVTFHGMATRDEGMLQAFQVLHNVAETDTTVLVRGESGTGKELAAKALHAESHRRNGPFLAINCATLSPTLLESELFGHKKGAFTGAVQDREGLFARADKGTLFLDEVAELPMDLQPKLLRVLQEQTFVPVGGTREQTVDVRIIGATHRSLRTLVSEGAFREDLMYRLRVVPVYLPPLRDRPRDIELLLWHFIEAANQKERRTLHTVHPDVMRRMLDHHWPGNVRELENVVAYAFAVGRGPELLPSELPPEFRETAPLATQRPDNGAALSEPERIKEALRVSGGNINDAAARLGMSRATFWRKRKKYII